MQAFLCCVELGLLSSCHAWASYYGSFSCFRARALRCMGFRSCSTHGLSGCGSLALEHRLSSWGTWALLLQGTWDIPRPGIESVSPALAGGFLTTGSLGKPSPQVLTLLSELLVLPLGAISPVLTIFSYFL